MMNLRKTLVTVAFFGCVGCAVPAEEAVPFDPQVVEEEAMEWMDSFVSSTRGGAATIEDFFELLDDHPDFVFLFEGATIRSKAEVVGLGREIFEPILSQTTDVQESSAVALGPDLAHATISGTFARTFKDGTSTEPAAFGFSVVLVRSPEGWKARFIHNSEAELEE